jgi:hypothetical protein
VSREEGAVKLILRSGGKVENLDPSKRRPIGLKTEPRSEAIFRGHSTKEVMILSAIANAISRASHKIRMTDGD